jgi:hypothetical protein
MRPHYFISYFGYSTLVHVRWNPLESYQYRRALLETAHLARLRRSLTVKAERQRSTRRLLSSPELVNQSPCAFSTFVVRCPVRGLRSRSTASTVSSTARAATAVSPEATYAPSPPTVVTPASSVRWESPLARWPVQPRHKARSVPARCSMATTGRSTGRCGDHLAAPTR